MAASLERTTGTKFAFCDVLITPWSSSDWLQRLVVCHGWLNGKVKRGVKEAVWERIETHSWTRRWGLSFRLSRAWDGSIRGQPCLLANSDLTLSISSQTWQSSFFCTSHTQVATMLVYRFTFSKCAYIQGVNRENSISKLMSPCIRMTHIYKICKHVFINLCTANTHTHTAKCPSHWPLFVNTWTWEREQTSQSQRPSTPTNNLIRDSRAWCLDGWRSLSDNTAGRLLAGRPTVMKKQA